MTLKHAVLAFLGGDYGFIATMSKCQAMPEHPMIVVQGRASATTSNNKSPLANFFGFNSFDLRRPPRYTARLSHPRPLAKFASQFRCRFQLQPGLSDCLAK
jgi:hypothetical protein